MNSRIYRYAMRPDGELFVEAPAGSEWDALLAAWDHDHTRPAPLARGHRMFATPHTYGAVRLFHDCDGAPCQLGPGPGGTAHPNPDCTGEWLVRRPDGLYPYVVCGLSEAAWAVLGAGIPA